MSIFKRILAKVAIVCSCKIYHQTVPYPFHTATYEVYESVLSLQTVQHKCK